MTFYFISSCDVILWLYSHCASFYVCHNPNSSEKSMAGMVLLFTCHQTMFVLSLFTCNCSHLILRRNWLLKLESLWCCSSTVPIVGPPSLPSFPPPPNRNINSSFSMWIQDSHFITTVFSMYIDECYLNVAKCIYGH